MRGPPPQRHIRPPSTEDSRSTPGRRPGAALTRLALLLPALFPAACAPLPISEPLEHCGAIVGDATWGPERNPHRLTCDVTVDDGVLTLLPGTIVRASRDTALRIGGQGPGGLRIEGTPDEPVYLVGHDELYAGFWNGVEILDRADPENLSLRHAHIRHAGSAELQAALYVRDQQVTIDHLHVHAGLTYAFRLDGQAGLADGSGHVTMAFTPRYTRVGVNAVSSLPIDTFVSEGWMLPVIEVDGGRLTEQARWLHLDAEGWPWQRGYYQILGDIDISGTADRPAHLTLDPRITLVMEPGSRIDVGRHGPGALTAVTSADDEITIGVLPRWQGHGDPPLTPDAWVGVAFHPETRSAQTVLRHVAFSRPGYDDGAVPRAAIRVLGAAPTLDKVWVQTTSACGIYTDLAADPTITDFTYHDATGARECTEDAQEQRR